MESLLVLGARATVIFKYVTDYSHLSLFFPPGQTTPMLCFTPFKTLQFPLGPNVDLGAKRYLILNGNSTNWLYDLEQTTDTLHLNILIPEQEIIPATLNVITGSGQNDETSEGEVLGNTIFT